MGTFSDSAKLLKRVLSSKVLLTLITTMTRSEAPPANLFRFVEHGCKNLRAGRSEYVGPRFRGQTAGSRAGRKNPLHCLWNRSSLHLRGEDRHCQPAEAVSTGRLLATQRNRFHRFPPNPRNLYVHRQYLGKIALASQGGLWSLNSCPGGVIMVLELPDSS